MGYGSSDRIPASIYPWWLILVGFIFGVIVTLIVTTASRSQPTVIYQPVDDQEIWLQATQMIHEATVQAQALDSRLSRPEAFDPLLQTATAIVIQATQQASR